MSTAPPMAKIPTTFKIFFCAFTSFSANFALSKILASPFSVMFDISITKASATAFATSTTSSLSGPTAFTLSNADSITALSS